MKDIFNSILTGNSNAPPEIVQQAFYLKFENASAVEWHNEGEIFESIFVYQGKEIICRFGKSANWIDTRSNQSLEDMSDEVLGKLSGLGEIMSSILIEKPDDSLYEFVIRDKEMNRQIYFTKLSGEIIEKRGFNSVYDLF